MAVRSVHTFGMDVGWFKARKADLKINDTMIGAAIKRDRTTGGRVIKGQVNFHPDFIQPLADLFEVSRTELLKRVGLLNDDAPAALEANGQVVRMEGASLEEVREDLPILGTALGASKVYDGEAIEQTTLNRADIIGYAKRPVILNRKVDCYGLYVQGGSMHPALPDGEMVAVSPKMPISVGDNVVVYLRTDNAEDDDGATARAVLVKELVRRTAHYYELRQYQPPKDFRIPVSDVIHIHHVLTRAEMLS